MEGINYARVTYTDTAGVSHTVDIADSYSGDLYLGEGEVSLSVSRSDTDILSCTWYLDNTQTVFATGWNATGYIPDKSRHQLICTVMIRVGSSSSMFTVGARYVTLNMSAPSVSTVTPTCNSVKLSGITRKNGYNTYVTIMSGSTTVSSGNADSSGNYTASGLSGNTSYTYSLVYRRNSTAVSASSSGSFRTKNPSMSLSVSDVKCTSAKITAVDGCGGAITYSYATSPQGTWHTFTLDSEGRFTGLTPGQTYYIKAVSNTAVKGDDYSISFTPTVTTTLEIVDGSTTVAEDYEVSYPRNIVVHASSNCTNQVTQYSYDNFEHTTTISSGSSVPIYKTCKIRTYVTIGSGQYGLKTLEVGVAPCTVSSYLTGTQPDALTTEVDDDGQSRLFETGIYKAKYFIVTSWDNSNIITKSKTYTVNGTSSNGEFVVAGLTYSLSGRAYFAYGNEVILEKTVTHTVISMEFTAGRIYASLSGQSNVIIYGDGAVTIPVNAVAGERITISASDWGTSTNTYEFRALSSANSGVLWSELSSSDGAFIPGGDSSQRILILYSTDKIYTIEFRITSSDIIGQTRKSDSNYIRITGTWFTCSVGVVADVTLLPDPAVGKIDTTEFTADARQSFVRGYTYNLTYEWKLYDGSTDVTSLMDIVEGSLTSAFVKFTVSENGYYDLRLKLGGTYSGGVLPETTWTSPIQLRVITTTGINDFSRFALVFFNEEKCFVASRSSPPYFTSLSFDKYLSNIGVLSCTITGLNKVKMDDEDEVESLLKNAGTYVCLFDRMNPVWIGITTSPSAVDTNYYNQGINVSQYNVVAYECQKVLSVDYIPNNEKGLLSGPLTDVVKKIIPEKNRGLIGNSTVNYGVSLSNTSRLTALEQLYSQCGWRYRCRPNTCVFWTDVSDTYDGESFEASGFEQGDIILFYANGKYSCAIAGRVQEDYVEFEKSFKKPAVGLENHVSGVRGYLIDFRPSYYQTYNTKEWTVNKEAQSVNVASNIRDKFGTAIVYGTGYSGETIASKMRAWMKIGKDYTIADSMKITRSYDSEIDAVVKLDEVTDGLVSYSRYTITFNGWSFPDASTLLRLKSDYNIEPTIYYVNQNGKLFSMTIGYNLDSLPLEHNPRRYFDQANNKKCAYTVAIPKGEFVSGDVITLKTSVVESLVQLSNVIFPIYAVDKPLLIPSVGSEICVGDMICTVADVNTQYSEVKVTYNAPSSGWEDTGIPHGHLTDVLVMDNSKTINYSNPDTESPYAMYPDVSLTTQGPEGYSIMEMERLACRYMQYGSNYSSQGTCTIGASFFRREDYEIGTMRLPMVGDRIALLKKNGNTFEVMPYELQRYEFDHENYSVKLTFGMPILNIGEVIYNMLSNAGMSIIPADS